MTPQSPAGAAPVVGCEVLDESECLRLLALEPVGRLALTGSALPVVLPINFSLTGHTIVFATESGLKLDAARARTDPAVIARLRDDTKVQIQPIAPTDGDRLIRFHETLSAETTRTRFFVLHPHLSNREVSVFTHVDHRDREAFVALVDDDIIGVARFDRLPNSARAEVAFVIADRWQGLGLATLLFRRLAERATCVGIRHFVAETLAENRPMLALVEHTGMVTHRTTDHGVVELEMDITPNHNTTEGLQ